jgi:hypothetical protein
MNENMTLDVHEILHNWASNIRYNIQIAEI